MPPSQLCQTIPVLSSHPSCDRSPSSRPSANTITAENSLDYLSIAAVEALTQLKEGGYSPQTPPSLDQMVWETRPSSTTITYCSLAIPHGPPTQQPQEKPPPRHRPCPSQELFAPPPVLL